MKSADSNGVAGKPILKWPGGKRWLAPTLAPILAPECQGTYREPFLGGGAVFFALRPPQAVLSDNNAELIRSLRVLRSSTNEVLKRLWRLSNSEDCYYRVRSSQPTSRIGAAVRFFYLNRTCWGGIYRLNQRGEFNVPFGYSGRVICHRSSLEANARSLKHVKLVCRDFELSMSEAQVGDVVYADPPYTTKGQNNGFVRYNEKLFAWRDQQRLADAAHDAAKRGVFVAISGLYHNDLLRLYPGWHSVRLTRPSNVAGDPNYRGKADEVVLFSRPPVLEGLTTRSWARQLRTIDFGPKAR